MILPGSVGTPAQVIDIVILLITGLGLERRRSGLVLVHGKSPCFDLKESRERAKGSACAEYGPCLPRRRALEPGTQRPRGGVVTQRIANPCTPVRFRTRPPSNFTTYSACCDTPVSRQPRAVLRDPTRHYGPFSARPANPCDTAATCWQAGTGGETESLRWSYCFSCPFGHTLRCYLT